MSAFNLLKAAQNAQRQLVRGYAFKSDLKIKWVRPKKIPSISPEKSGDLSQLPPISPNEYMLGFQQSKELQSADPLVQSLFQLGSNRAAQTTYYQRDNLIKEVQRHSLDYGSLESKLARMTATIRKLQVHMDKFPQNKKVKVFLKELIEKRKKYLKFLRRYDYRRFEWLLEKLDLVYKPPPDFFHWITRKESLQKLTDRYCRQVQHDRLQVYRKQLEAQLIPFLEEAVKKLKFIRQEQIDCDVPVTVTEEQISEMQKELETLKELEQSKIEASAQKN